jgi:hypothetical protein
LIKEKNRKKKKIEKDCENFCLLHEGPQDPTVSDYTLPDRAGNVLMTHCRDLEAMWNRSTKDCRILVRMVWGKRQES